jgi:hypothetical protein
MLDAKIPPHVTIVFFQSSNKQELVDILEENVVEFKSDKIFFSSIEMFLPSVLYLSPILNEYLTSSNMKINEIYSKVASVGDCGRYVPYSWVPHAAVATKMNNDEMRISFQVVQDDFKAFQGNADEHWQDVIHIRK